MVFDRQSSMQHFFTCTVSMAAISRPEASQKSHLAKGFPWLSNADAQIVNEATSLSCSALVLVTLLCSITVGLLEHTEDLGIVLMAKSQVCMAMGRGAKFACVVQRFHICNSSVSVALTSKLTRLMCNFTVRDRWCHKDFQKFDKNYRYLGPLPGLAATNMFTS